MVDVNAAETVVTMRSVNQLIGGCVIPRPNWGPVD
jgi:hypothetical protein